MQVKYLLEARVTLPSGKDLFGPVTTVDDKTYLYRNTSTDLDYYMELTKTDGRWRQCGGPSIQWRQEEVDQLGLQIDTFLIQNPILNKTALS